MQKLAESPQIARVLVVEDNQAHQQILCDLLAEEGFDVVACGSAAEALACLGQEDFAVAIIDQRLPDRSGTDLLMQLHAVRPALRAIIHTGHASFDSARDAVNHHAFAYVEKRGHSAELIRHVHRAVQASVVEALQQSQADYQRLVESVQAIVWRSDPDTLDYRFVSHEAEALLGYPVERWLEGGSFWQGIMHAEDHPRVEGLRRRAAADHQSQEMEYRVETADGREIWLQEIVRVVVKDGEASELVGVMIEITARKQAEAEREVLISELEAKNAELERFAYTISHDLKNPLVTIKGFLGLLEQDAARGDTERMNADIAQIADAADKMSRLLSELLELSRIGRQINPPKEIALLDLVHETVGLMAGRIKDGSVEVEIAPEMPVVAGDRMRLMEVFQNLIDNAVKYMGDQPEPRVEVGARQEGAEVVCYVRDNGVGIDPKYHEKVFGLFDRLDQHIEGTGIGLALVKRIVEVHGGRVWVESEGVGHGCTFVFTLPRQQRARRLPSVPGSKARAGCIRFEEASSSKRA